MTPKQKAPVFWFNNRPRPVTAHEATAFGLEVTLFPDKNPPGKDPSPYVGTARASELWIEAPLGGGWRVAYRLALEARRPVVIEMRVLPAASGVLGQWHGYVPGVKVLFPRGGITTRLIKTITLRGHVATLDEMVKANPAAFAQGGPFQGAALAPREPVRHQTGRGRPSLGAGFYARLAADYVAACRAGGDPVAQLAQDRQKGLGVLKSQVARARRMGYLTEGKRGLPGGNLTERAREVLARDDAPGDRSELRRKGRQR